MAGMKVREERNGSPSAFCSGGRSANKGLLRWFPPCREDSLNQIVPFPDEDMTSCTDFTIAGDIPTAFDTLSHTRLLLEIIHLTCQRV